jgi:hypothetical protein
VEPREKNLSPQGREVLGLERSLLQAYLGEVIEMTEDDTGTAMLLDFTKLLITKEDYHG